jgi:hypothetical protein
MILAGGEERLKNVRQVARTDTMMIVDAPQTMLTEGRHKIVLFRYVFLVHPRDGALATVVWRINPGRDGTYQLDPGNAVRMQPNLVATCALHVDGREITAGIPSSMAFATTRLPVGEPVAMPEALRSVAGQKRLPVEAVGRLEAAARRAMGLPMVGLAHWPCRAQ